MTIRGIFQLGAGVLASFALASTAWANAIVVTNSSWTLSTTTVNGGPSGPWAPSGIVPPALGTFTLGVTVGTNVTTPAASAMGGGTQSLQADGNVHFYRTTFNLSPFASVVAQLQVAVDNDVMIFINGAEIARELDFTGGEWSAPFPSLTINSDGSISNVVKFNATTPFTGFSAGLNEVVLAVRNPNSEGLGSGGVAFRMDVTTEGAVPEPGALALLALGLAGLAFSRRRKA